MKKILIFGATGMAGHMIYNYLTSLHEYIISATYFKNKLIHDAISLDVYNINGIRTILKDIMPDVIINCIGILVKGSNKVPKDAIYINSYFPHLLCELIEENSPNTKLIHISTDCVFSGSNGLYKDTDIKDALDIYGITKNLGEIINNKDLTIRTSIIGPELKNGEGLFHWIFSQQISGKINGYEKSIWSGVTTLELAKAIEKCIKYNIIGLYQLTNGIPISKYELIQLIINLYKLKINLYNTDGLFSDKSLFPSEKRIPDYKVPSYNDMISELYDYMYKYKEKYIYYFTT